MASGYCRGYHALSTDVFVSTLCGNRGCNNGRRLCGCRWRGRGGWRRVGDCGRCKQGVSRNGVDRSLIESYCTRLRSSACRVERQNCAKQDTDTPHERAVEAIPELRFG